MNAGPGKVATIAEQGEAKLYNARSVLPKWLPGSVAQSVLRDVFDVRLPSLIRHVAAERRARRASTEALAERCQRMLDDGEVATRAELARREGVSRARVSWVLA